MSPRLVLLCLVCFGWLSACSAGANLGITVPIGPNVGVGLSVGTDGRVGVGVGVSSGGGQIGVGTSGQLPVKKNDDTGTQK